MAITGNYFRSPCQQGRWSTVFAKNDVAGTDTDVCRLYPAITLAQVYHGGIGLVADHIATAFAKITIHHERQLPMINAHVRADILIGLRRSIYCAHGGCSGVVAEGDASAQDLR